MRAPTNFCCLAKTSAGVAQIAATSLPCCENASISASSAVLSANACAPPTPPGSASASNASAEHASSVCSAVSQTPREPCTCNLSPTAAMVT
ncbi:Uncharacterised protein [Vibrio cholerae]|nr:Uncharacterised protein [Vibrio cholerae]